MLKATSNAHFVLKKDFSPISNSYLCLLCLYPISHEVMAPAWITEMPVAAVVKFELRESSKRQPSKVRMSTAL
jgi:hypothetical protein